MHAQRMATLNVLIHLLLMEINGRIGGWLLVVGCWLLVGYGVGEHLSRDVPW